MNNILEILEKNGKTDTATIAAMLGKSADEIKKSVDEYEKSGVINGYTTLIDWDKTDIEKVTALIEVKVTPQRGEGFDKVAERIYKFKQVRSCYLMSGGFDLTVIVEGRSMKEVALFVAEKLAPIENVLSTSTHFVLKKYKDMGVSFEQKHEDNREVVVL